MSHRRGPDPEVAMRVVDVDGEGPLLDAVYTDILAVTFPPDELETREWLSSHLASGTALVTAALDEDGAPLGAAVGGWLPGSRVLLLAYLAVRSGVRTRGTGSRLLAEVTGPWQRRLRPRATFAEVENPLAHTASEGYGDPAARVRFYARQGTRALDLPYFQPALRPGSRRVYGMLLTALHLAPEAAGAGADTVDPAAVRAFLLECYDEPLTADDPATAALRGALDRPGGVPLLPLDDVEKLPLSRPH